MKNKKIVISLIGITAILATMIPFFINAYKSSNTLSFDSKNLLKNEIQETINLENQPLTSNVVTKVRGDQLFYTGTKNLVDANNAHDGVYQGQSVLSNDSLNTVRSSDYFFNFIPDLDRENKINLVATAVNPNLNNNIIVQTNFTKIDDSAIFINNNLLLIATIANKKFLVNYQFETNVIDNGFSKKVEKSLKEKDRIDASSFFNNMANKKYALSPYTQNFEGLDYTAVLLWPMGINAGDLISNINNLLYEIQIDSLGNLNSNDVINSNQLKLSFESQFSNHENLKIVSLTPIQTINQDGSVVDTNFFGLTAPTNSNLDTIKVFQFNSQGDVIANLEAYDFIDNKLATPAVFSGVIAQAPLETMIPYAMPRIDVEGNFYLFSIVQNGADRLGSASSFIPEALIQLKITIDDNNQIALITDESILNSLFRVKTDESADYKIVNAKSRIEQLYYAQGSLFGDSYISTRNYYTFSNIDKYTTSILPVKINSMQFLDYVSTASEWYEKQIISSTTTRSAIPNRIDSNVVATVYNEVVLRVGYDYYPFADLVEKPPIFISSIATESNTSTYHTFLPQNFIYLPAVEITDPLHPLFNRPIKIQEIDFTPWRPFDESGTLLPLPVRNSIMWYLPHYIDNIESHYKNYNRWPYYLFLTGETIFRDRNDDVILAQKDVSNEFKEKITAPENAESVQFDVTIPFPYVNGHIVQGQPLTISFIIANNPGIPSVESDPVVQLNQNFISGSASQAANILETLNLSKTIPLNQQIVGTTSNNLFAINPFYFKSAFQKLEVQGDDFEGKLDLKFTFMDQEGRFYEKSFLVSGFQADFVIIPSVIVPLVVIGLIVLTVVLVLNKKNKLHKKKSIKLGYVLAKKIEKNYDFNVEKLHSKKTSPNNNLLKSNQKQAPKPSQLVNKVKQPVNQSPPPNNSGKK